MKDLERPVPLSFPGAIQAVAALEDRISQLYHSDEAWARRDAQRAVDAIREVFGIRRMTDAEIDAAHEHAVAQLDALIDWQAVYDGDEPMPDAPLAIVIDYPSKLDEYQARGA